MGEFLSSGEIEEAQRSASGSVWLVSPLPFISFSATKNLPPRPCSFLSDVSRIASKNYVPTPGEPA